MGKSERDKKYFCNHGTNAVVASCVAGVNHIKVLDAEEKYETLNFWARKSGFRPLLIYIHAVSM